VSKPVRYERQIALAAGADGFFKPMKRVVNDERPKSLCRREYNDGLEIELRSFWQLDIYDETVALAIIYLAQEQERGCSLSSEPQSETGKVLRKIYDPDGKNELPAGIIKHVSINELAAVMGIERPGKRHYDAIKASLKRLGAVTMTEKREQCDLHHPVAFIGSRINDDGKLDIVINNRLAMAAFGDSGFTYTTLDLEERKKLRSDIAKAVHRFLVGWMWNEGGRTISLEKLARHVWGDDWDGYTDGGKRCHLKKLKEGVLDLNTLTGWMTNIEGRGSSAKANIGRKGGTAKPKRFLGKTETIVRQNRNDCSAQVKRFMVSKLACIHCGIRLCGIQKKSVYLLQKIYGGTLNAHPLE